MLYKSSRQVKAFQVSLSIVDFAVFDPIVGILLASGCHP
jgi:hypothetical protein